MLFRCCDFPVTIVTLSNRPALHVTLAPLCTCSWKYHKDETRGVSWPVSAGFLTLNIVLPKGALESVDRDWRSANDDRPRTQTGSALV